VNDRKKQHGAKLDIAAVRVGDGNSAKEIKKAKLVSHGIIAKDREGKLLTKVDGHDYGQAKVDEVINKLLAEKKPAAKEK